MTPNDLFPEKPSLPPQVWLIGSSYPQNIQRTLATSVNKRSRRAGAGVIASQRWIAEVGTRRPVSRVLCRPPPKRRTRRSFLWTAPRGTVLATYPDRSGLRQPCPIAGAHGPYSVLLLAGLAMPSLSPGTRWALTPPFHPSR